MAYAIMLWGKLLNKEDTTMTKQYIQPAVQVAPIASMSLMQVASPVSGANHVNMGVITDDQW